MILQMKITLMFQIKDLEDISYEDFSNAKADRGCLREELLQHSAAKFKQCGNFMCKGSARSYLALTKQAESC